MSRPRPQAFPVQGNWPPHMRGFHVTPRSPKTLPTGEISCNWPPFKVPKVQLLGPKVPGQEQHKTKGIEHIGALRPGRAPRPCLPRDLKCPEVTGSHPVVLRFALVSHALSGPQRPTCGNGPDALLGDPPLITILGFPPVSHVPKSRRCLGQSPEGAAGLMVIGTVQLSLQVSQANWLFCPESSQGRAGSWGSQWGGDKGARKMEMRTHGLGSVPC